MINKLREEKGIEKLEPEEQKEIILGSVQKEEKKDEIVVEEEKIMFEHEEKHLNLAEKKFKK